MRMFYHESVLIKYNLITVLRQSGTKKAMKEIVAMFLYGFLYMFV